MCLIIDVNIANRLCGDNVTDDARPVIDWIIDDGGRIVLGGKLTKELTKNAKVSHWIRSLLQAGRVKQVESSDVENAEREIKGLKVCKSNDVHIVALARASGARLLYSLDKDLHADFTNSAVLSSPRGKVYQNATHSHLLTPKTCRNACV